MAVEAGEASGLSARRTARLLLRRFTDADRTPFAAMNADPVVMEHFPEPLGRTRSDRLVDRIEQLWDENGWGLWAVERLDTGELTGFTGLAPAVFEAPFTPAVEVGWRLARRYWGHGYAAEAGREALRVAFDELDLPEVVSFTAVGNLRSRAVMERLGLRRDLDGDFEHPSLPAGHPLRPHVLYRVGAQEWHDRDG